LYVAAQRAVASSLVFIILVGLIKMDASVSFTEAISTDIKAFAFVAFNLFADGVSLLETRWVLQRGANAGVAMLLALLLLDLVLSAIIFLILPTILWEVPAFLEAALFRGDRPWLGILFWTTFSTSVMFYVFVLAALLLRPIHWLTRLVYKRFDVEAEPVIGLAVAMALVVTVGFAAGAGSVGIYNAVN